MSEPKIGVLFVCLGNICRSPMAKGIFLHQARQRGVLERFDVDSCGTGGWHAGGPADPRTVACAAKNGITFPHVVRQVAPGTDFARFHYLLAMDLSNRDRLLHLGAPRDRVHLMRKFDATLRDEPEHRLEVPDPYQGGDDGFQRVYEMLWRASEGLLIHVGTP